MSGPGSRPPRSLPWRALFALLALACSSGGGGGAFPDGGAGATAGGTGSGGTGGQASTGGGSGCSPPSVGAIDGSYYFALATTMDDTKPVVFAADVTTESGAAGTATRWVLHPLLWSDRKTEVDAPIELPPQGDSAIELGADGAFSAHLLPAEIPGDANPFSHSAITVDVTLKGSLCGAGTFFCGTASGNVTKPVPISLDGSTWTLEKTAGTFPEPPKINCAMELAAGVGTWK